MMEKENRLTKWVINKINAEYEGDIALLLAVKGHATDHDGHGECFDYFIPATKRGNDLAQTFIIDGIGHDLYPRSWERVERSADLEEMAVVLANAEILYARSQKDADRFRALQEKQQSNLKDTVFVYRKALERVESAMELYQSLVFEVKPYRTRSKAAYIHLYLSQAVAYLNHTFADSPIFSEKQAYSWEQESRIYHCPELYDVPASFFENARRLLSVSDAAKIKKIMYALVCSTRDFVLARRPAVEETRQVIDYQGLSDWYQELSLTWRRIHYFCENNMVEEAYHDACYLQDELVVIAQEFQIEELNLLDSFSPDHLSYLDLRCQKLEQFIRSIITDAGISINEYASVDEFLAANA